jgi:hypothetical protein
MKFNAWVFYIPSVNRLLRFLIKKNILRLKIILAKTNMQTTE